MHNQLINNNVPKGKTVLRTHCKFRVASTVARLALQRTVEVKRVFLSISFKPKESATEVLSLA